MLFFVNDTATTEIYTLSLHDALPIFRDVATRFADLACRRRDLDGVFTGLCADVCERVLADPLGAGPDRKSTRLNSSHANISYAVFCLKKKINAHITSVSHHSTLLSSR